jgi:hypothetical protein
MKHTVPETPPELEDARVTERPDGYFYWQPKADGREYGPFPSYLEAVQDMQQTSGEPAIEPGETAEEAMAEIGIADWLDPDTGEPKEADGPRIEDH